MSWERYARHRDRITSKSGGWTIGGTATLHGYDIHQELGRHASWMQVMLLSSTGRLVSSSEGRFLEKTFILTGYPDARLWCNRVAALAGTSRCSATSSLAAGVASAEARIYGRQADYKAAHFLVQARRVHEAEGAAGLQAFVMERRRRKQTIFGFGRPLLRADERIVPLGEEGAKLGIPEGEHLKVAREIEAMLEPHKIIMNYGGYVMARLLDLGFNPQEIYRILTLTFYTGLVPGYTEAYDNEPGTFLPIACEDVLYEGVSERELPG